MYAHKTFQNSGDIYPMPAPEDPNYQNIVQIIDNKPEVVAVAKKVDQKVKVKRSWSEKKVRRAHWVVQGSKWGKISSSAVGFVCV